MNTRLIKKSIGTVLAFILSLFIFALIALLSLSFSFLRPQNMQNYLDSSDYYQKTLDSIREDFHSVALPGGIPQTLFDSTISISDIKNDIQKQIYYSFNNKNFSPDTASLKENLKSCLKNEASSKGITITDQQQSSLDELVSVCLNTYETHIKSPLITATGMISFYVSKLFFPCVVVISILIGMLLFTLFKLFLLRSTSTRFMSYALLGGALMILVPSVCALISQFYQRIHFYPIQQYNLFVATFLSLLVTMITVSLIVLGIGVILVICSNNIRHKGK